MDANELVTIAIGAMDLSVLTPFDQGHVEGVLTMALLTMETQHESLLAEADEEAAATMRTLVETQNELIVAKAERDGWRSEARELQRRIDELNAENSRIHRSMEQWMSAAQHTQVVPPGAVQVK
jgi:hypothetical protein